MTRTWYYAHKGQSHGPFTAKQIKYFAATGGLQPEDLVWPSTLDPEDAVPASQALDFPSLRREAQAARQRGQPLVPPPPPEAHEADVIPLAEMDDLVGWQAELSQLFRDREEAVGPVPDWLEPEPTAAVAPVPDWMSEEPPQPTVASAPPPVRTHAPVPPPPRRQGDPAPGSGPFFLKSPPPPPRGPAPGPPTEEKAPPALSVLEQMGVDPATGRIVDQARFLAWQAEQRQEASEELPPPRDYDPDPFRTARKQLAAWLDGDRNRVRLQQRAFDAIRADGVLLAYMSHFEKYGAEKCKNLWDYLNFLMENRVT